MHAAAFDFDLDLGEVVERDEEAWRALTEVSSQVEAGVGYVSDDSFRHGRYTGLHEEGAFGILNLDIRRRDAWDAETARFWSLRGENLGLDSRYLRFDQGRQGNYSIFLEYDQLPHFRISPAFTPFEGVGGTQLTLPEGGGRATLDQHLRAVDIDHERRRFRVGGSKLFGTRWEFRTSFAHETKEGTKVTGINMSDHWANPQAVLLPEPIDHVTNRFGATVAYKGDRGQAEVGYHLSLFENQNRFFTVQNPHAATWPTDALQWAQAPDNEFHQVRAAAGYNLTRNTRVFVDGAVGRMYQDEEFLSDQGLPTHNGILQSSLAGMIDTTVINAGVSSRPLPRLNLTADYRYDERDNRTPEMEFEGKSTRPFNFEEHRARVAADYRLLDRTNLMLRYQRSEIDRTFVEREETDENTYEARLRTAFGARLAGGLQYAQSNRRGSTFIGPETRELPFHNPDLRQFAYADRDRERLGAFLNYMPTERLTFGFSASRIEDDYKRSELGLTDAEITVYSVDAAFLPRPNLSTYAFFTYEDSKAEQVGETFGGLTWQASHRNEFGTVGVGARLSTLGDRLELGTDVAYGKGVGHIRLADGQDLPSLVTDLRQLSLFAGYKLGRVAMRPIPPPRPSVRAKADGYTARDGMTVQLRYRVERYDARDWSVDGIAPGAVPGLITLGEESPDYTVHVIGLSLAYRFH
jgi:MtrB/PioB family decaheme-associated outer membrane protein